MPDPDREREQGQENGKNEPKKKKRRRINREYTLVAVFFLLIFFSLAGYLVYFQLNVAQDFINSPYNTRQDTFTEQVIRGNIVSADGETLAYTNLYEDGTQERIYPYGRMFAHVIGYDSNGKSGLESEANFLLLSSHNFFVEQLKNQFRGNKNTGDTVRTSLDTTLQAAAYNALGDRRGAIIAIEPKTGRIICEVSKPDFDPNDIVYNYDYIIGDENDSSLLNRTTDGAYPPGSTFKVVDVLNYYRQKGTLDGYHYICEGSITQDGHTLQCYDGTVHGEEDMYSAFAQSCNCAFAQIGVMLGAPSMISTAEDLLFNKKLPFSSYRSSTFPLSKNASVAQLMQTAIGQGDTLVSPAHLALITCAIANQGKVMMPTLIDEVVSASGDLVKKTSPSLWKQLITEKEAAVMGEMMENVVTSGTGYGLSYGEYTAAGKTGSAEFNEDGSSHSWFIGYCNVDDPELVVSVIVENGGTGSESAVPIAAEIFDSWYYYVKP